MIFPQNKLQAGQEPPDRPGNYIPKYLFFLSKTLTVVIRRFRVFLPVHPFHGIYDVLTPNPRPKTRPTANPSEKPAGLPKQPFCDMDKRGTKMIKYKESTKAKVVTNCFFDAKTTIECKTDKRLNRHVYREERTL